MQLRLDDYRRVGLALFLLALLAAGCAENSGARTTNVGSGGTRDAARPGLDGSTVEPRDAAFVYPDRGPRPDVPNAPQCQPGRYVGEFAGDYRSQLVSLPIQVRATGTLDGQEGLEFMLVSRDEPCAPNEEFCADFSIEGGKIRGNADWGLGALAAIPFEIDLVGELDCDQGILRGRLENGHYSFNALIANFEVEFAGTADGDYIQFEYAFENGVWAVTEVPPQPPEDPTPDDPSDDFWYVFFAALTPMPPPEGWGGEGTWWAALVD